jgi:hypothetical protein
MGGMVAGYVSLLVPGVTRFWQHYAPEWDKGLIALILNVIVVWVVAMASRVITEATSARRLRLG